MFTSPRILGLLITMAFLVAAFLWVWSEAEDAALSKIERQNNDAARRAEDRALDYDACRDAGRVWSFGSGKCGGPAVGGRD